jgi:hypothetical protein
MNVNKWEKSAELLLKGFLKKIDIDDYYGVAVDVVPDNYSGYDVHITFLMKKSFKLGDSDKLHNHRAKLAGAIKDFLPELSDRVYISTSTSTLDNYNETTKPWYEKLKKERLQESILKELRDYNSIYDPEIINEASKKQVLMNKVGMSEENAEYLDRICGSLSVWMANKLIDLQLNNMKSWQSRGIETELTKENALEKLNSGNIKNYYNQKITEIMDWIRVGLDGNVSEYKSLSIPELLLKSKEWHDSLGVGSGEINYTEKNPIIKDFRNEDGEGFYWVDLQTNDSPEECSRMGHCGRTAWGNNIYSLREVKKIPGGKFTINKSHLTASIGRDGTLYQLKGPKNSKPKEEFHDYILPLFFVEDEDEYLIQGFGSEYASDRDFKLTDLPNEVLINLYQNRPDLFKTRRLEKKLIELGIIEKPEINYNLTIKINPDDVTNYVNGDWVLNRRKVKNTTPAGHEIERTVETWLFETILSGDAYELWENYDVDWKSSLQYDVDNDNEKRIRDLIKHIAQKNNPDFDEETFNNEDTEELIEDWDDDNEIRRAISNATSNAESDEYVNYLYNELKGELEEYGRVEQMNDEGVILHVNVEPYLDDLDESWFDDYMERCDDDIECVFYEMVRNDDIDKPKFSIDDRWYPSIDSRNFNDILSDYLSEAEYHYTK